MELYQIRYFLSAARTLNFTRAAEECHVSQPALTKAIQKLEAELGGPLFRREGRRSHVTELGKSVIPMLSQCYQSALSAKHLAEAIGRGEIAHLRLGIAEAIPARVLDHPLREMGKHFPGLDLDLTRAELPVLGQKLEQGEIEVAFVLRPHAPWERLNLWRLYEEPLGLAVPAASPLAREDKVTLAKLADVPILKRGRCGPTQELLGALAQKGLKPKSVHHISSGVDREAVAHATGAVGLSPKSEKLPGHTFREIEAFGAKQDVALAAVGGRPYSRAAGIFIKLVRAMDWRGFIQKA